MADIFRVEDQQRRKKNEDQHWCKFLTPYAFVDVRITDVFESRSFTPTNKLKELSINSVVGPERESWQVFFELKTNNGVNPIG